MSEISEKFGLFDDGRKYVIVFNMQSLISPIRHIVELHENAYDKESFAAWYYENYRKLDGDDFLYCTSSKEMRENDARIKKEWDETTTPEEARRRWNLWKESQHNENM